MNFEAEHKCGHVVKVNLSGKNDYIQYKLEKIKNEKLCPACYAEHLNQTNAADCEELEMSYSEYKNNYANCKTKTDSYNKKKKTIVVYVPNNPQDLQEQKLEDKYVVLHNGTLAKKSSITFI